MNPKKANKSLALETQLVHVGNDPSQQFGYVSPPIYRGSTAIYENIDGMKEIMQDPIKTQFPSYGRYGSPNARALEQALAQLEGGYSTVLTGTGLSAITTALLAFVEAGDHILMVDSVYWPTRHFCDSLVKLGIETEYYDPRIGTQVESLFRKNTKLVYMESPGSVTFEVQDVPAIASLCRSKGIITLIDNTWATPLYFKPLHHRVDCSIHSGTKYLAGHSDSFFGAIICNETVFPRVRGQALKLGQCAGAEDIFFGLRGLRTLAVRMQHHQRQALDMAEWLSGRPEVFEVLYPALPSSRDYALWKRDFTGASGLLAIVLKPEFSDRAVEAMVDSLELFGLGHSWGGFESLAITSDPSTFRKKENWSNKGALVRLHVGVENLDDLKTDLARGFGKLQN